MRTLPFIALAVLLPAPSRADDGSDIRAAAQGFEQALAGGDPATLERIVAPDFLFVRASGRVGGKRDLVEGFTGPAVKIAPITTRDPLFLRISQDAAIVGGGSWIKGTENGRPFTDHYRFSTSFARRGGRWVAVYMQITGLPAR